ncbi:MAG TPA: HD domain-containing phosphohydrolase [Bryobacteraceae bacterium]|nr:HD domain-containing phosphohydrolase [Bryobacteraceae bacterium]
MSKQRFKRPRVGAAVYIGLVVTAGAVAVAHGAETWDIDDWVRFSVYSAIALMASGVKVVLPGATATMSMNYVFVLIGIAELGLPGTLAMGCLGMLVQCVMHTKSRPKALQVAFSVASMACSVEASYGVYRLAGQAGWFEAPLRLLLAAAAFFGTNTFSVAAAIALTEGKRTGAVWRETYLWTFPNYLAGAAVAWAVSAVGKTLGWQTSLLVLPVVYFISRSHSLHIHRLESEGKQAEARRKHAEEVAALHRRAIQTLALAIEAKDQTTHDHLERVEVYAIEVGKELGLSERELEALRAAALLHDVGKLAVPEYIISKPGKLTPEEFEKMKTHTVVGAELVERMQFPYAVAPIVRSHHEKWNGSGYPDGLRGEEIPIGARILSAVDCLDALASDRQYRRALPLEQAIETIRAEAGKSFDPRVVEVLVRRYVELERMATADASGAKPKLSTGVKIARGAAPAAGFEASGSGPANGGSGADLLNFHRSIGGAWDCARVLPALIEDLQDALDREEAFARLRKSLREIIHYDAMAVYLRQGDRLIPGHVDGEEYRLFSSLEIPLGAGLSGWVAENGRPIVNGNPSVEPGYLQDPVKFSLLRSALAVPLETRQGILGVLSLYRHERDSFGPEHLTLLLSIGAALALVLEGAAAAPARGNSR